MTKFYADTVFTLSTPFHPPDKLSIKYLYWAIKSTLK